ncbi:MULTISPECIES: hypothetical protein [Cupriavidus]|nr:MULTISPECIES: hypothetical protein [Cupriavidus]MCO4865740.1 hypothetical protein [Cupriavidus sp. WGlv3]MCO4893383.1 hypothetical protein [Cupriavidus sp. WGtm5]ULX56102.1 hypothetical protein A9P79_29510 [Cupriavidus taiwanensis]CAP63855.1 conserved hypothetical protein [Cupriavidus taiwanensis LMG 19424]SOY77418.1 conserved hypothetical protein [Cupriavidus taiwanensis]
MSSRAPLGMNRAYLKAVQLVHQYRAASVPLVQRHLGIGAEHAESLLARMATETTVVRRMPNGLYLYVGEIVADELTALYGFAEEVLAVIASGEIDVDALRAAAVKFGLSAPRDAPPYTCLTLPAIG